MRPRPCHGRLPNSAEQSQRKTAEEIWHLPVSSPKVLIRKPLCPSRMERAQERERETNNTLWGKAFLHENQERGKTFLPIIIIVKRHVGSLYKVPTLGWDIWKDVLTRGWSDKLGPLGALGTIMRCFQVIYLIRYSLWGLSRKSIIWGSKLHRVSSYCCIRIGSQLESLGF